MISATNGFSNENGFTLVELMVVVAIIGLLSAVAVPNFKKYQAKAKTAEAKLQLSAVYTAQAGFYSDYNMYAHCLGYMGYDPSPEFQNRYYAVGFRTLTLYDDTAFESAINSGLDGTSWGCPNNTAFRIASTTSASSVNIYTAGKGVGSFAANAFNYVGGTSTIGSQGSEATMTFTAGAGGVISQGFTGALTCSQFTIDQNKVLRNVRNGY